MPNGLDLDADPPGLADPVPGRMIFPGSVTCPPNRDAVARFAAAILPRIRAAAPGADLRVTGAAPADAPQAEGQRYTGRVPDIRAETAAATLTAVPLRLSAGGARFEVIESLAPGTPVVSTATGVEGLALADGGDYAAAEGEAAFADACISVLTDPALSARLPAGGRARMEADHARGGLFTPIEATMLAVAGAGKAATERAARCGNG